MHAQREQERHESQEPTGGGDGRPACKCSPRRWWDEGQEPTGGLQSTKAKVLTTALVGGLQHKHMEARTRQSLENHV